MPRNSGKGERNAGAEAKGTLGDDVDALFSLPLAEFTGARNALAARLKQSGRANDATLVKALAKPSISAWAVNQLYWRHREAFETLISAGKRLSRAQKGAGGKVAEMRESLDARRDALSHLSDLASTLLRDAGHNPTLDTLRRITTTLEGLSVQASHSDGPTPGRLTHDVDPPGFDSLASLFAGGGTTKAKQDLAQLAPLQKSGGTTAKTQQYATPARDVREIERQRQTRIATAKVSLHTAKRALTEARVRAERLEGEQKRVYTEAKVAEKRRREAEDQFKKTSAAAKDAERRVQNITAEAKAAAKALEDARRTVEKATRELESLFRSAI
jgi:DNA repair exonuclease SbcCD ATPase subunit